MKKLIVFILFFAPMLYASEPKYTHSVSGKGATKCEALAMAWKSVPNNVIIQKPTFNGYSTREYVPGIGYVQTQGSYKCTIYYKK
jgi:hypothetical protein